MPIQKPSTTITTVFCEDGVENIDYVIPPDVETDNSKMSMQKGYPLRQAKPRGDGGIPPKREETNGILRVLSEHAAYQNAGGMYTFDQAIADKGGYAKGSVLLYQATSESPQLLISLVDNNTNDFNNEAIDHTKWDIAGKIPDTQVSKITGDLNSTAEIHLTRIGNYVQIDFLQLEFDISFPANSQTAYQVKLPFLGIDFKMCVTSGMTFTLAGSGVVYHFYQQNPNGLQMIDIVTYNPNGQVDGKFRCDISLSGYTDKEVTFMNMPLEITSVGDVKEHTDYIQLRIK